MFDGGGLLSAERFEDAGGKLVGEAQANAFLARANRKGYEISGG